jgi:hypothetical protein
MQQTYQVGAVIHRYPRTTVENGPQMAVINVAIFAMNRVAGNPLMLDQGSSDVILGGKGIGGARHHLGSARFQRAEQIGGLAGDMQAGAQAKTAQRFGFGELLADATQDGHLLVGPQNTAMTRIRQPEVGNVIIFLSALNT